MSQFDASRAVPARPDALTILRSATAHCHASLEKEIDWPAAFRSPTKYRELLRRFLRVVEPLEGRLERFAPVIDTVETRARGCRLRRDIEAVQCYYACGETNELNETDERFDFIAMVAAIVVDRPTALGALYVLEGSALGGQILSRHVQSCASVWPRSERRGIVQLPDERVIDSYFQGRGAETGRAWGVFCQRLNHELPDAQSAVSAAQAAEQTFEVFHLSLAGKRACVRP